MTRRTRISIIGPYSHPSPGANTQQAMEVTNRLLDAGYAVFCPHLCYFLELMQPRHYEEWMEQGFAWLETADAVLRLPGRSPGADREERFAFDRGIPVYFDEELLIAQEEPQRQED